MPRKEHSLEEKLVVVKRYLSGESATSLEHEYGIDHHDVVMYVNRYVRYGEDGLKPRVSNSQKKKSDSFDSQDAGC